MPYKDPEKQKSWQHKWYLNNKQLIRTRSIKWRTEFRRWYKEYKESLKCSKCGFEGKVCPEALSFHHSNPGEKEENISRMINDGRPKNLILKELAKCDVLCENCHRKEHPFIFDPDKHTSHQIKIKTWFSSFKSKLECEKCGEKDIRCLEFHHINYRKEYISEMIKSARNLEKICKELEKCVCLCANCHRKLHYNERLHVKDLHLPESAYETDEQLLFQRA